MNTDFSAAVKTLNPEQRQYFYELFAHFLTVFMRGVLFTEGIADGERVDRAKWLNEIAHRITYQVFILRKGFSERVELDVWTMIEKNVEKNRAIEADVNSAIEWSLTYIRDNETSVSSEPD